MVKENDIRINQTYELFGEVKTLSFSDFSDFSFLCENLNPIKISRSILEGIGCEFDCYTSIWHLGSYQIYENDNGEFEFCFFRYGEWHMQITYLHQLQNIYFALTEGEEIKDFEIKPK